MSRKLLEKLGSREEIKRSFINRGYLLAVEYEVFWSAFDLFTTNAGEQIRVGSDLAATMLGVLFETIESSKRQQLFPTHAMLNTLNMLSLLFPLDLNFPDLKLQLQSWCSKKTLYIVALPQLEGIMRNLVDNGKNRGLSNLDHLVKLGVTFFPVELLAFNALRGSEKLSDTGKDKNPLPLPYSSVDKVQLFASENMFVTSRLLEFCEFQSTFVSLNEAILTHLRTLVPQHIRLGLPHAQNTVLALLFLFIHILSQRPPTVPLIAKAISAVEPFFMWSNPVGLAARKVLWLLHEEYFVPGAALRRKLLENAKCASARGYLPGRSNLTQQHISCCILNGKCPVASSFSKEMGFCSLESLNTTDNVVRRLTTHQRILVLLNILQSEIRPIPDNVLFAFTSLSDSEIGEYLDSALLIIDRICKEQNETTCLKIRAEFRSLGNNIARAGSGKASIRPHIEHPDSEFIPVQTEMAHIAFPVSIRPLSSASNSNSIPSTTLTTPFCKFLEFFSSQGSSKDPIFLRVCILGNDALVHQTLCTIQLLRMQNSQLLSRFRLSFYVIPFGTYNSLACYLANNDLWYGRHILWPFRILPDFLLPKFELPPEAYYETESRKKSQLSKPGKLLCDNFETYLNSAKCVNPFRLFRCDIWSDPKTATRGTITHQDLLPDMLVPFAHRLEIGIGVYIQQFCELNGISPRTPYAELSKMKGFSFSPKEFHVHFNTVSPDCKLMDSVEDEILVFNRLILSHIPPQGDDHVFPADPSSAWLEMYLCQTEKSKKKGAIRSRHHVNFLDVYGRKNAKFYILVDGEVMGPFFRICIQPFVDQNENPVVMSFQSFLPISL